MTTPAPSIPAGPPDARRVEGKYLAASQAAAILQVSPKTVSRWAKEGKLPYLRTLGGHRRYPERVLRELVAANTETVGS